MACNPEHSGLIERAGCIHSIKAFSYQFSDRLIEPDCLDCRLAVGQNSSVLPPIVTLEVEGVTSIYEEYTRVAIRLLKVRFPCIDNHDTWIRTHTRSALSVDHCRALPVYPLTSTCFKLLVQIKLSGHAP